MARKTLKKDVKTWSTPQREEERISVPCTICGADTFIPHFPDNGSNPLFSPAAHQAKEIPDLVFFSYVRCVQCGLVQINPQPSPEAIVHRYDKNSGNDYLEYELANEKSFLDLQELALNDAGFYDLEKKLFSPKETASRLTITADEKPLILDIGCATGALLTVLKNRGWAVQGVEISGPQAEYCRKKGLTVSKVPLEKNNFSEGSFDVVLASHVIEHLNNPSLFVREVYRILKPNGHFFVTTPNIAGFQAKLFGSRWRSAIFDHLYLFSVKTLRKLLEQTGFNVEQVKTWGGLAEGTASPAVKKTMDKLAKRFGFGDVMIMRARR
jgi:2-polyprenyl-3-methyl-5-hydroxy-6-metoxy-1,4-benzoquinol methylase